MPGQHGALGACVSAGTSQRPSGDGSSELRPEGGVARKVGGLGAEDALGRTVGRLGYTQAWGDLLQGGRQSPGEEERERKREGGQHGVNSGNPAVGISIIGGDGLMNPGFQQGGSEDSIRH